MAQLQTLNVEYDELTARADELEARVPEPPSSDPEAPCRLPVALEAARTLKLSADNMRLYLPTGERERRRLAESLRNAAKAYEEVDGGAAEAMTNGTSVWAPTLRLAANNVDVPPLADTRMAGAIELVPKDLYLEVKYAAVQLSRSDEGKGIDAFADAWTVYRETLLETTKPFRPFQHWAGEAVYLVEANFDQQKSWLKQMAQHCATMATQARNLASAHRWAMAAHPTLDELAKLEQDWFTCQSDYPDLWPKYKPQFEAKYAELQHKSEEVLAEYRTRAALPWEIVLPDGAPGAYHIAPPPPPPNPDPRPRPEPEPEPEPNPDPRPWKPEPEPEDLGPGDEIPYLNNPYDHLPVDEGRLDPTGLPIVPSAGIPPMPNASKLTGALPGAPGRPTGAGLKPASVGGGGVGGGVPSMPLQPSVDAGAARPGTMAPAAAGLGRGIPGVTGAMGGGGMGMAPMGAPGTQGQDPAKSKRAQQDVESLYTEERPWTEGVIGRRRSKDAPVH
jgi:ESX-1 secreted protein B PE domain